MNKDMSSMDRKKWLHCVVSVDCGETLGSYQGRISSVDEGKISLASPFLNGLQCQYPEITINACDIQYIEILSEVGTPDIAKLSGSGDCGENNGNTPNGCYSPSKNQTTSESKPKRGTVRKGDSRRKQLDMTDDCLNTPISNDVYKEDFDFEKNLALFDKHAMFKKIDASNKPDVVRLVDHNRRPQAKTAYRSDENVLEQTPTVYRQIQVPQPGKLEFVTDMGLVVPSISLELRTLLLQTAERLGFSRQRQLELMGRSASDMVLQLLGGSYRLNPHNSHQIPTVVLLCGPCLQGIQALNCGRHLANHGVHVTAYVPNAAEIAPSMVEDPHLISFITEEMALFSISDGKLTSSTDDLSQGQADIIIYAMDGHFTPLSVRKQPWYQSVVLWASNSKAPVLSLDPSINGVPVNSKWSLVPVLPLDLTGTSVGSVYLLDLAIPRKVFLKVGIGYLSPFGPKCVIPLHMSSGV